MLLSDRDIRQEIAAGRVVLEPYDDGLVQPSSIDVRLDRYFRTFENHRYPHIDPAVEQPDLTRLLETAGDEPFILHPGEFVLASTYEVMTLPDDVAGRLEGKALALDTVIPTPVGWRTMGDLQAGDVVFDEAGLPEVVLATSDVLTGRPCFEVVFSDGTSIVADGSHDWATTSKADRKAGRSGRISSTVQIARQLRVRGEWNHHVDLAGAVQCPERELPVDPYVLGVWLGDGTTTKAEVTCGRGDEQVLDEIVRAGYHVWPASGTRAFRIGGLSRHARGRRRDVSGRYRADESLSSTLRALGLLGCKHVPDTYLFASAAQRLALLQGLMDSDGYVDEYGRCEFVNTREQLADSLVTLAASLGLRPTKRKKRAMLRGVDCGPAYQVKFSTDLPVFRLRRKLARLRHGRFHRFRAIIDVRPTETRPVRCIQVGSPRGLYLVGPTFIPTHNSSLGRLGLLTHSTAGFIDPGFSGHVTLELSNVATLPIKLWPGMKIGQLCLFRLSSPAEHPYGSAVYGSRYQGQRGPTASRSWQSFSRTRV